ncbi:MAG: glutathione S-transferase C-terminal domain-containing protein [Lachnospiraceae bacterium]|nr:glutathione S-transferase C-terminal domain-containing protein [Lachnospiraceae bacterium]
MADVCSIGSSPAKKAELLSAYTDEQAEIWAQEAGIKPRPMETKNEIDERGAFVRQANSLLQPFGDREGDLKAEAGTYAIYWAHGCNWSNRPVIARDLLGLQDVILDQTTSHTGQSYKYGHGFGDQPGYADPITGVHFLSEFYKNVNPDYTGRATTPTLVNIRTKEAVNNDYHRLSNYIEVQFRPFQPADAPDLYPKKYRKEIDEFNDWLFPHINNGHYRMAFCQSYEAYAEAFEDFYDSMDKLEKRLETNRFLFGDYITDSDIRFYVTLVRWDTGYFKNVGPIKHRIVDYKNIWGYVRDLYSIPTFAKYTFFNERPPRNNENDLFRSWEDRIQPQIDYRKLFSELSDRARLSKTPEEVFLRHPAGETYEEYAGEISFSRWNRPDQKDRNPSDPANNSISVDASINPLQGLL